MGCSYKVYVQWWVTAVEMKKGLRVSTFNLNNHIYLSIDISLLRMLHYSTSATMENDIITMHAEQEFWGIRQQQGKVEKGKVTFTLFGISKYSQNAETFLFLNDGILCTKWQ